MTRGRQPQRVPAAEVVSARIATGQKMGLLERSRLRLPRNAYLHLRSRSGALKDGMNQQTGGAEDLHPRRHLLSLVQS